MAPNRRNKKRNGQPSVACGSTTSLWAAAGASFAAASTRKKVCRHEPLNDKKNEIIDLTESTDDEDERTPGLLVYMMGTSNYEAETIRKECSPVLWKALDEKNVSVHDICWADKSIKHEERPDRPPRCINRDAFVIDQNGQAFRPREDWETCCHETRTISPLSTSPGENIQFASISTCETHMAGISHTGELYTWGDGTYCKLGHGSEHDEEYPRKVQKSGKKELPRMQQVVCNNFSTLALDENGKMWSFGFNSRYETGHGELKEYGNTKWPRVIKMSKLIKISQVTACNGQSGAVDTQGRVYTWGYGKLGALGHGDMDDVPQPRLVEALCPFKVQSLSCGWCHMGVTTTKGEVLTWGSNISGQLGIGINAQEEVKLRPVLNSTLQYEKIGSISCGHSHTGVVSEIGDKVYTWGANNNGELGHGVTKYGSVVDTPRLLNFENPLNGKVMKIICRNFYSALLVDPHTRICGHATSIKSSLAKLEFSEIEGSFPDVEFEFNSEGEPTRPLYAHRFVLSLRCEYFNKLFHHSDNAMRPSVKRNGRIVIAIPDCYRSIFSLILDFIYEKDLNIEEGQVVQLFQKAEYFLLPSLKNVCRELFQKFLTADNCLGLGSEAIEAKTEHPPCQELVAIWKEFMMENEIDIPSEWSMKCLRRGFSTMKSD